MKYYLAAPALLVMLTVLLIVTFRGTSNPVSTPVSTPVPEKATWGSRKYFNGTEWLLVCTDSSKVIATVRNARQIDSDNWEVFGGDGNQHGEFLDVDKAKAKAEWVTQQTYIGQGTALNHCP